MKLHLIVALSTVLFSCSDSEELYQEIIDTQDQTREDLVNEISTLINKVKRDAEQSPSKYLPAYQRISEIQSEFKEVIEDDKYCLEKSSS